MKLRFEHIIKAFITLVLCIIVWQIGREALWIGDEIRYMFNGADGSPLTSVFSIPSSLIGFATTMNARFVAHFLVQLFCGFLGQEVFAIVNALVWGCALWWLMRYSIGKQFSSVTLACAATLLYSVFSCKMTPSVQIGYLWMTLFVAGFLYAFRAAKTLTPTRWQYAGLLFLSLCAGNAYEAVSPALLAILVAYMYHNRDCNRLRISMLIAFAIGVLTLFVSAVVCGKFGNHPNLYETIYRTIFSLRTTWILVLFFPLIRNEKPWYSWTFALMATIFIMHLIIGVGTYRQLIGVDTIALILIIPVIEKIRFKWRCALCLTLCAITFYSAYDNYLIIKSRRRAYDAITTQYIASLRVNPDKEQIIVYYDFASIDTTSMNRSGKEPCAHFHSGTLSTIAQLYNPRHQHYATSGRERVLPADDTSSPIRVLPTNNTDK